MYTFFYTLKQGYDLIGMYMYRQIIIIVYTYT